jgi:hypothetical protein
MPIPGLRGLSVGRLFKYAYLRMPATLLAKGDFGPVRGGVKRLDRAVQGRVSANGAVLAPLRHLPCYVVENRRLYR